MQPKKHANSPQKIECASPAPNEPNTKNVPKDRFFWRSQHDSTSFLGIDIAVWIYKYLGSHATKLLLVIITTFIYIFSKKVRKISLDYLTRIRAFAKQNNVQLAPNNVWLHIYRFTEAVLERVLAWYGLLGYKDLYSQNDAIKRMQQELASPSGAVIIGGHIGSIELLRGVMKVCGGASRRVNIVIETNGSKKFLSYLKKINDKSVADFIAVDDINPATAMELQERVKNGEWVVILGDRLPHQKARSLKIPFLGSYALLPEGPWILALLLKVPIFTLFAVREERKVNVYFEPLGELKCARKERQACMEQKALLYAQIMQRILLKAPLDWFNFYDYFVEADHNAIDQENHKC